MYCYFEYKVFIPTFPWGKGSTFSPVRRKGWGRGGISGVCIDVQHLERFPDSSGILASPVISDHPPPPAAAATQKKIAVRGSPVRGFYASKREDTIRTLKHSNADPLNPCAGTARPARPGGAHSPGSPVPLRPHLTPEGSPRTCRLPTGLGSKLLERLTSHPEKQGCL